MSPSPESKKGAPAEDRSNDAEALTFEDAVKRIETIVQTLERGDLPLEESLRLFEEGIRLSRASQGKLDGAQKRVEELLGFERDGSARTAPFETRGDRG